MISISCASMLSQNSRRSVVEKGEGFVDKMRHWENHREREATVDRGLKRSRSVMTRRTSDPMDDSDDVMILDSTPDEEVYFRESPRKKRALSVDIVDAHWTLLLQKQHQRWRTMTWNPAVVPR
jgi:hypothetical protein